MRSSPADRKVLAWMETNFKESLHWSQTPGHILTWFIIWDAGHHTRQTSGFAVLAISLSARAFKLLNHRIRVAETRLKPTSEDAENFVMCAWSA